MQKNAHLGITGLRRASYSCVADKLLAHNVHLGITGLRRTGKTVFLTSLIYQLRELGSENLDCLKSNGVTLRAAQMEYPRNGAIELFPYTRCLEALRQTTPHWPEATLRESGCVLRFYYEILGATGIVERIRRRLGMGRSHGTILLHLHDYPGEYLLDAGLIGRTYEQWSDETLEQMRSNCPDEAQSYQTIASEQQDQDRVEVLKCLRSAYGRYAFAAREKGLEFIQPAMALLNWYNRDGGTESPGPEELPFVPLTGSFAPQGPLIEDMRERYRDYVNNVVTPFVKRIRRCRTQLVLVDVLRVLRNGVEAYNDTRQCIAEILHAYHAAWRLFRGVKRVLFAATKADHATKSYRPNMTRLLDELVFKAKGHIKSGITIASSEWLASVRATEDGKQSVDGRPHEVLVGVLKGSDPQKTRFQEPGAVPAAWPFDENWEFGNGEFDFPEFEPRPVAKGDGAILPHINLDRVIWKILKDSIL
jgi:uncharacterized protein